MHVPDFSASEGRRLVDLVYTGQTTPAAATGEGEGPLLLLGALQAALGMALDLAMIIGEQHQQLEEVEAAARRSDRARTPSEFVQITSHHLHLPSSALQGGLSGVALTFADFDVSSAMLPGYYANPARFVAAQAELANWAVWAHGGSSQIKVNKI